MFQIGIFAENTPASLEEAQVVAARLGWTIEEEVDAGVFLADGPKGGEYERIEIDGTSWAVEVPEA